MSHYTQVMFFEPINIPRALNTGTCIGQGDLFYFAGPHRNRVLATANTDHFKGDVNKDYIQLKEPVRQK